MATTTFTWYDPAGARPILHAFGEVGLPVLVKVTPFSVSFETPLLRARFDPSYFDHFVNSGFYTMPILATDLRNLVADWGDRMGLTLKIEPERKFTAAFFMHRDPHLPVMPRALPTLPPGNSHFLRAMQQSQADAGEAGAEMTDGEEAGAEAGGSCVGRKKGAGGSSRKVRGKAARKVPKTKTKGAASTKVKR